MKKLAVITGASKGIGKETAKKFTDENWDVINLSRTLCDNEKVVSLAIDLANDNLKEKLKDFFGQFLNKRIQICLVHNACSYFSGSVGNENLNDLHVAWKVNILAPIIINQLLIPYMKSQSSILYIGSTLSEIAVPGCMSYVISKHALLGLMRSTCQDLSGRGIHTCCICPGFTETEMLTDHLNAGKRDINVITDKILMKRLIQPREIADFIFYSANQPILNGAVLHANLGSINN